MTLMEETGPFHRAKYVMEETGDDTHGGDRLTLMMETGDATTYSAVVSRRRQVIHSTIHLGS